MPPVTRMADVASRLLMLAVMVRSLPGRAQFERFAGAALQEVPGVAEAIVTAHVPLDQPPTPRGWTRYDFVAGCETYGFVELRISEPTVFGRHAGDVQNVVNLLAHELERRATMACLQEAHEALARSHEELTVHVGVAVSR